MKFNTTLKSILIIIFFNFFFTNFIFTSESFLDGLMKSLGGLVGILIISSIVTFIYYLIKKTWKHNLFSTLFIILFLIQSSLVLKGWYFVVSGKQFEIIKKISPKTLSKLNYNEDGKLFDSPNRYMDEPMFSKPNRKYPKRNYYKKEDLVESILKKMEPFKKHLDSSKRDVKLQNK